MSDPDAWPRLERTNASASVPIETTSGGPRKFPNDESDRLAERFVDEAHQKQYARFLDEQHHHQYGSERSPSPWAVGRCLFESVVAAGVRPEHRVLDFACGALRIGVWLIPYLNEGNYFGVDSHLPSLEAAVSYEVPLHALEQKRPRLLWNEDLTLSHFGTDFDWIVDYNGSRRVRPKGLRAIVYERFAGVLASSGRLLVSPHPAAPIESFPTWRMVLSRRIVSDDCQFFIEPFTIRWWEFIRA